MRTTFLLAIILLCSVFQADANPKGINTKQVAHAEYKDNLNTCLQGGYYSCRHNILTPEDTKQVAHAEYKDNPLNKKLSQYSSNKEHKEIKTFNRCAENNSCYGDISTKTGRPKTTHVTGYYRRNGTYVRGHYRSK